MASVRQRGTRFTAIYRDQEGAQRSAGTFDTAKDALKKAKAAEALEKAGHSARAVLRPVEVMPTSVRGVPTLAACCETWLQGARLRPGSRRTYRSLLTKHVISGMGMVPVNEVRPPDVRALAWHLEETVSSSTAIHVLAALRRVIQMAMIDYPELGLRDVTAGVSVENLPGKTAVVVTREQARQIEAALDEPYRLAAAVGFATACRYGELVAIRGTDVRDQVIDGVGRPVLQISRSIVENGGRWEERGFGKTARAMRPIPISGSLASRMVARAAHNEGGYVIRGEQGGYMWRNQFAQALRAAAESIGVEGMTPHSMRHSVLTWLCNEGVPLARVQAMSGHSHLQTLSRYVHRVDDADDQIRAVLGETA